MMFLLFKSCKTQTQQIANNADNSIQDSIAEKKRLLKDKFNGSDKLKNHPSKDEAPVLDKEENK